MDSRKLQIMETAIKLFSNQGYHSTSVQEIAKECGIAKGLIYKYFQSKEDLFVEILEYFQNEMFERAVNTSLRKMNKKEALKEKIIIELDDFLEKKELIMFQFKELPSDNPQLVNSLKRIKINMMKWHQKNLYETYGQEIEPFIMDTVLIFQGILKEYLFVIINEDLPITLSELAEFTIERLDNFVEGMKNKDSGLIAKYMNDKENQQRLDETGLSTSEKIERLFVNVEQIIKNLDINNKLKNDLHETLQLLKEEHKQKEPRSFLIYALLDFLKKEKELSRFVDKLHIYFREENIDGRA